MRDAASVPLDCSFVVRGTRLPVNNGYALYAAICSVLEDRLPASVGVRSLGSRSIDGHYIYLDATARLRFRLTQPDLPSVLRLAGKRLQVEGCSLQVGCSSIMAVRPAEALYSRMVTFKGAMDEATVLLHAQATLDRMRIIADVSIPGHHRGQYRGQPRRQILPIRGDLVVGYSLMISGLSPEDSLTLLATGLGGRRHMGCGIFEPTVVR